MTPSKTAIAITMALLLTVAFGHDAVPYAAGFAHEIQTGDDLPVAAAVHDDGAILIVGFTALPNTSDDPGTRGPSYASMLDAAGRTLWTRRDFAGAVTGAAIDPTGAVTIVGSTYTLVAPTDAEVFVTRLGAQGATVWERRLTRPPLPPDLDIDGAWSLIDVSAVVADARGNVAIVGSTMYGTGGFSMDQDTYVTLLHADGTTRWTRTLEYGAPDSGWALAFDPTGDVIVVGGAWGAIDGASGTGTGAYVWRLDATGATRWVTQFGALIDDTPTGVAITADGKIIVVGDGYRVHENHSGSGAFVRAFDGDGTPLWTRPIGQPGTDSALRVTLTDSGTAIVLTNATETCSTTTARVWGFTTTGATASEGAILQLDDARVRALAQDAAGNLIVVGTRGRCSGTEHGFVVSFAMDREPSK